jgi:hypothetical protein
MFVTVVPDENAFSPVDGDFMLSFKDKGLFLNLSMNQQRLFFQG